MFGYFYWKTTKNTKHIFYFLSVITLKHSLKHKGDTCDNSGIFMLISNLQTSVKASIRLYSLLGEVAELQYYI